MSDSLSFYLLGWFSCIMTSMWVLALIEAYWKRKNGKKEDE